MRYGKAGRPGTEVFQAIHVLYCQFREFAV